MLAAIPGVGSWYVITVTVIISSRCDRAFSVRRPSLHVNMPLQWSEVSHVNDHGPELVTHVTRLVLPHHAPSYRSRFSIMSLRISIRQVLRSHPQCSSVLLPSLTVLWICLTRPTCIGNLHYRIEIPSRPASNHTKSFSYAKKLWRSPTKTDSSMNGTVIRNEMQHTNKNGSVVPTESSQIYLMQWKRHTL